MPGVLSLITDIEEELKRHIETCLLVEVGLKDARKHLFGGSSDESSLFEYYFVINSIISLVFSCIQNAM